MSLFKPEAYLTSIDKVDLQHLSDDGIDCLLLDLDNTLRPRDTGVVPMPVREWLHEAHQRGFRLCVVSNNWHGIVLVEAARLGLPVIHKAMKPFPAAFVMARKRMGSTRKHSVAIGDQVLTDVLGAHLSGMKAILVLPQSVKDLWYTQFFRKFERKVLKGMSPTR